jgi:hypothetical protein
VSSLKKTRKPEVVYASKYFCWFICDCVCVRIKLGKRLTINKLSSENSGKKEFFKKTTRFSSSASA